MGVRPTHRYWRYPHCNLSSFVVAKMNTEVAVQLLKESRECIAACFRTIAASDDRMIMGRLEMELALAEVKHGIGVRLQNFIAEQEHGSSIK